MIKKNYFLIEIIIYLVIFAPSDQLTFYRLSYRRPAAVFIT